MIGLATLVLTLPLTLHGADWPQFRGPHRDGISRETGLLQTWPKEGPSLVWTFKKAGAGLSGPAIVGGKVYLMGLRDGGEVVFSLDEKGQERWAARIGPTFDFKGNSWSAGPLGTPSVDGDAVYALSSQGELVCVDAAKGTERWRKNLPKEMAAEVNPIGGGPEKFGWGFAWSPLVDGDHLIITPGGPKGLFAALDKKTGNVIWQSKEVTDQATYSSPLLAEVGGVRQYLALTQSGVVGVAAKDGKLLWEYKRQNEFPDVVIPTPLIHDGQVYVTAWKAGSEVIKLTPDGTKFKATSVWFNGDFGNVQGGVVLVKDHVYGYNEDRAWTCQEFATGKVVWESKRRSLGAGAVVYADGNLYCLTENGDVGLLAASPDGYKEKGRFPLPEKSTLRKSRGKVWTHPVIADGHLYLRDQEFLYCYKIK
jgi:outer membrane protein assembly factor BamB